MFIPYNPTLSADTIHSQWNRLSGRSLDDDSKSSAFPIPAIIGVSVGAAALLIVGSFLVLMHCLKRRDKEAQNSVSSMSGQPLLVSSRSVSPRETFTSMSRPDGFFSSRGPVSVPATTYGSRLASGSMRQPAIIGPATQILGGSARRHDDEDPEPMAFTTPVPRTTRGPPRKASRWSHLPPIPTIREAANEPDSVRGAAQYLAGTSSGTHPVATRLNPSTRPQSYGPATEARTRPASVTAAAEGSAGTAVGAHSMATASTDDRDDHLPAPAGDAPSESETRARTISSTSSQFSLADHPALGKTVSKPRATYARPGRLISGRGQPSA